MTCHSYYPSYESKVRQMFRIDSRGWIDLQGIVVATSILQQSIHRIQHLMGKKEEPFPGRTSIVKTLFTPKYNIETATKILRLEPHYLEVHYYGLACACV